MRVMSVRCEIRNREIVMFIFLLFACSFQHVPSRKECENSACCRKVMALGGLSLVLLCAETELKDFERTDFKRLKLTTCTKFF